MPFRFAGFVSLVVVLGSSSSAQPPRAPANQSSVADVSGVWVLNPSLTQRPAEIGFNAGWAQSAAGGAGEDAGEGSRGGRGRRSGGAARVPQVVRESADDSTRATQLTAEARTPPSHLTIVQKTDAVSITDDQGLTRTFHPDGRLEELTLGTVPLPTTARWTNEGLEVVYDVESGWRLRYRYAPSADRSRLVVDIRFIQQGREGDEVRLTYEPPDAHERAVLSGSAPASASAPAAPSGALPPAVPAGGARPAVLPPGSELRGITTIGTVVDDLSAQATACGLDQAKIKASVARVLADAGFKSQPFGDEETYVWINVVTSRLADGTCVSRYDASLMAQADATLPYLKGLVAVEVPLLRDGGLSGGAPAAHAKSVTDALTAAVTRFVTQIRNAGK